MEAFYEKYMAEIEEHCRILIQICMDYGKEVGRALSEKGVCDEEIAGAEAEKVMLMGTIRYLLDVYQEIMEKRSTEKEKRGNYDIYRY